MEKILRFAPTICRGICHGDFYKDVVVAKGFETIHEILHNDSNIYISNPRLEYHIEDAILHKGLSIVYAPHGGGKLTACRYLLTGLFNENIISGALFLSEDITMSYHNNLESYFYEKLGLGLLTSNHIDLHSILKLEDVNIPLVIQLHTGDILGHEFFSNVLMPFISSEYFSIVLLISDKTTLYAITSNLKKRHVQYKSEYSKKMKWTEDELLSLPIFRYITLSTKEYECIIEVGTPGGLIEQARHPGSLTCNDNWVDPPTK
jgi:hypothetical protein